MDYFLFWIYFLLSYSKNTSQSIAGRWVWNTVFRFGNSSPKGGTGWWLNWLTEVPEGSPRFENICWYFIVNLEGPSASWTFFCMTRSIYSVLYKSGSASPNNNESYPPRHLSCSQIKNTPFELKCSPYSLFKYYILIHSIIFISTTGWISGILQIWIPCSTLMIYSQGGELFHRLIWLGLTHGLHEVSPWL